MVEGLVSTIIPVYNRPRMLKEAVVSVLAQTYRPIEIIIVDDASTDDTMASAQALAREHREIKLIALENNGGPGVAREAGRRRIEGEFVQHLDSDDILLPYKFELQVEGLRAHADCGASYGKTYYRRVDGSLLDHAAKRTATPIETMFPSFLRDRWWHTPTPLYRRQVIDAAGAWTTLRAEEDWEYDCRIAAQGTRLHHVDEWIVEVRQRPEPADPYRSSVMRDRAAAHLLILGHALRAGITPDAAEMRHFARELFLLARQCGAAGLGDQSKALLDAARVASGSGAFPIDFTIYKVLAGILGWKTMGKLSTLVDRIR